MGRTEWASVVREAKVEIKKKTKEEEEEKEEEEKKKNPEEKKKEKMMKKKKNNKNKKNKNKKTNRPPRARTKLASTFLVWTHHTKFHRNISSSLYELRIVHCVPVIPWEPNPSRLCSSSCP